jgi:mannose-6-phosphate isomerase-like protein (cupin superfamily)
VTEFFTTLRIDESVQVTAPDGSSVRPLCTLRGAASFAQFELAPRQLSKAISHTTVQEIWYVVSGGGDIWRSQDGHEETTALAPGTCLTVPLGTTFQFRAGRDGLVVVAATVPPWPDAPGETRSELGPW